MDKLASRLNKAVTRAGGGINNQIAAQALKELGWTYDFAERIKELEAALQTIVKARENRPDNCSDEYLVWCCIDTARAALEGKHG